MKPFIVEFTIRTVVMADDDHHAFTVARDQFREIARDETPDVWVESEVINEDGLPEGWDLHCLPYGGDGKTRLVDVIDNRRSVQGSGDLPAVSQKEGM